MNMTISDLSFTYSRSTKKILDGITMTLSPGVPVFLLGANGAGKSTLLKLMCGVLPAPTGSIRLDEKDLNAIPDRVRASRIGVMLQSPPPVFDLRTEEFVLFGRNAKLSRLMPPTAEDHAAVRRALAETGLSDTAKRPANTLSGGEFQRLRLAALLSLESEILLLDEPTSAQDPAMAQMVLHLLTEKAKTKCVFIITHDVALAQQCSGRVVLLAQGKLIADGTPDEVIRPDLLAQVYGCDVAEKEKMRSFFFSSSI